jgi:CubicO group peptidase (beta-lactamase class C family)
MRTLSKLTILTIAGLGWGACSAQVEPVQPGSDAGAPALPPDAMTEQTAFFPSVERAPGEPGDYGLDPGKLDEAADYASSVGSSCFAVIREGHLVYERYYDGSSPTTTHKTYSIAKSFTSTLVGIAIERGEIESVDQAVSDFVEDWVGTDKEAIRIADLLSMQSGLDFDLVADNLFALFVSEQTEAAIQLETEAGPGEVWHYSNRAVQVLHRVLSNATGLSPEVYAQQHLWGPLGMKLDGPSEERMHWERDDAGDETMYMSVYSSCRDLARLGYLYQHQGRWKEEQVVNANYVASATDVSQSLNAYYGYLWWVNGEGDAEASTGQALAGKMMPFAPDDLFSAQGLGQTFIDVVPSTKTVYVHIRPAPQDAYANAFFDPLGTMEVLLEDGLRIEHKALLRKLIAADVD